LASVPEIGRRAVSWPVLKTLARLAGGRRRGAQSHYGNVLREELRVLSQASTRAMRSSKYACVSGERYVDVWRVCEIEDEQSSCVVGTR
jgi:hypothetical protein